MKKRCDLHTHSRYSDGTYTPAEIVEEAKRIGLSAVALTDHNTVAGVPEFLRAAEDAGIEGVAGIEISTDYKGKELHIVGLFLEEGDLSKIEAFVRPMLERKAECNRILVNSLAQAGYKINLKELEAKVPNGRFNRAHVAEVLQKRGYVSSIKEAFSGILAKGGRFYVEPERISVFEAISFLRSLNAAAILAHPFLNLSEEELERFLPQAKEYGLVGLETAYSEFDENQTRQAEALTEKYGLVKSGGSDFHGSRKPDISLGAGKGDLFVPAEFYEKLKERMEK